MIIETYIKDTWLAEIKITSHGLGYKVARTQQMTETISFSAEDSLDAVSIRIDGDSLQGWRTTGVRAAMGVEGPLPSPVPGCLGCKECTVWLL